MTDTVKCNRVGKPAWPAHRHGAMRVTIPAHIRDKLNLNYGDEFKVSVENNRIVYEKVR